MQSPNGNDGNSTAQAHKRLATGHVIGGRLISEDARQAVWEIVTTLADSVILDTAGTLGVAG